MKLPRRRLIGLALGSAATGAAHAQPAVSEADQAAIRGVIAGQMDAFRRDDAEGAFAFASPMIQGMFGTATRFMAMVQAGYQPVYRPRAAEFGAIVEIEGRLVQKVEVVGPDGAPVLALYTMQRGADGWRIDGCALTESERPGV